MASIEESFATILITIAEYDKSIDILRRILSENEGFDCNALFQSLDKNGKKKIDENDITNFLNSHKITNSPFDIRTFITFYDSDLDAQLSYPE